MRLTRPRVLARKRRRDRRRAERARNPIASTATAAPLPTGAAAGQARISHEEVRTIFFGLMLAALLAALNQTIIATALPTIGRHFADFENLSWIVTAYLLTSTAVAPLYGKLSDIYGRRTMMQTGRMPPPPMPCRARPTISIIMFGAATASTEPAMNRPMAVRIMARRP